MKWSKHKRNFLIFDFISIIILIAIDQYTKYLAVLHLKDKPAFSVIDGVFELNYLENRGAAFGILQGKQWFFLLVAAAVVIVVLLFLSRLPFERRYLPLFGCMVLLVSGAVGNVIDRLMRGFVVDFLYFSLIDFPIFNVADCYVVVAACCLILLTGFFYKDEEFDFLNSKPTKEQ